jgi:DNA-binding transcriptional regulator LsrR (DeoR family)
VPPGPTRDSPHPGPGQLVRAASIARRYFLDSRSKSEIATEFGLSRFKVARILDEARAAGIVHIDIRLPAGIDAALADELRSRFNLRHAIVLAVDETSEVRIRQHLAHASAALLTEIVTVEDVLGVGYGRTLTLMAEELTRLAPCPVVQLTGALMGVNPSENSVELVRQISALTGGTSYSIYAPQVLPDAQTVTALRKQPEVSAAYAQFDQLTKAVVAVGSWAPPHSQLYDSLPARQRAALCREGASAEICAVLLDKTGKQVASDFTNRCISISATQLKAIPEVVAVASGVERAEAVRAVLEGGFANSLVVDTELATNLLADELW